MSGLYSTLLNSQGPHQNPIHIHPPRGSEETVTNFEQHYVYNSRQPGIQPAHEPALFHNNSVGWPESTSWTLHNSFPNGIPSSFIEQMQAKNQLLAKYKKDMDKQAAYIYQLEKQLDVQNSSDLLRRLQDRERDVEHLRARLESETTSKYELKKLRRNVGEAEYELEKTEKVLEEMLEEKATEAKQFQDQISGKVKELEQTKQENIKLQEEKSELIIRVENLDKYVSDLPTSEDYKRLRKELKHWKHQCSKLQTQMTEQEETLTSGRNDLEEKALNAERFEKENADLRRMVKSLQDRMKNDETHSKALELEHVTFENERLQAELAKMKKILKEKQNKTKNLYIHSQESMKKLQQRLSLEEDTVTALRKEISTKELSISELKSRTKQLLSQYQDVVKENMDINDNLKKLQIKNSKETVETNRNVYKQLRRNVNKLKDIMRLYYQRKEGRDLDLSLLLGTGASADRSSNGNQEKSLSDDVDDLTNDIDEFQKFLADEYAEELANNLEGNNCITQ